MTATPSGLMRLTTPTRVRMLEEHAQWLDQCAAQRRAMVAPRPGTESTLRALKVAREEENQAQYCRQRAAALRREAQ